MLGLVTLLLLLVNYGAIVANSMDINGWYPCTLTDVADQSWLNDISFECASVEVPLCHPEICTSSKMIKLFVKRKLAIAGTNEQQKKHKSLWLLAAGPGASSADCELERYFLLELGMVLMYALLDSSVDVYTVDHRGTGRSSPLDCVATQAMAEGSPNGPSISLTELPYCIKDVLQQIDGHTEAFSVASAARDLIYLIQGLEEDETVTEEVYLYGTSYGTFLVERIMHLAPTQVKGYILDGVVSEAGPDPDTRTFFSHWDHNILASSRRFFELCLQQQGTCPLQLDINRNGDVLNAVLDIYDEIDVIQNNCATQLLLLTETDTPSNALRPIFGLLVRDPALRSFVPSILARMQRCNSKDEQELELVIYLLLEVLVQQWKGATLPTKLGKLKFFNDLTSPLGPSRGNHLATTGSISIDQLDGVFSVGSARLVHYCLLLGNLDPSLSVSDRDPACDLLIDGSEDTMATNYNQVFTYRPDEYSNQIAPVPPNASLMVINGGLL
ncbi:unnamed protein product [Phytophthora fragariaefolia]|uniref:Unnamed protein product n=1 Tax=Phytophthora fragariaefolia TaxID=1490495 RepID=A0A9W6YHQ4_9STRA|nr:unnamed protein product [Phytophthora fragariaefolia]